MASTNDITTLEEFTSFVYVKAFDVIGNGAFRKHLSQCRETGDPWALTMAAHNQTMAAHIREVHGAVGGMPKTQNRLHEICKDVSASAQPPVRVYAGAAVCRITGKRCARCLDLSKSHKGTQNVFVDLRFTHFLMSLWYVCKIEYITRSITRMWLDARGSAEATDARTETFSALADAFKTEQAAHIARMHRLFCMAKQHVILTLSMHAKSCAPDVVLKASIRAQRDGK